MDFLQILTNIGELWSKYWQLFLFEGVKNTLILTSIAVVLGVAIGTLSATIFKALYYMIYTARKILHCHVWKVLGRFIGAVMVVLVISCAGMVLLWNVTMANFFIWGLWAVVVFAAAVVIALLYSLLAWPKELKALVGSVLNRNL